MTVCLSHTYRTPRILCLSPSALQQLFLILLPSPSKLSLVLKHPFSNLISVSHFLSPFLLSYQCFHSSVFLPLSHASFNRSCPSLYRSSFHSLPHHSSYSHTSISFLSSSKSQVPLTLFQAPFLSLIKYVIFFSAQSTLVSDMEELNKTHS